MGKIVEKKKKKKGRPSLIDLQKRNLKLQQQQQIKNKTPNYNSNPNPNPNLGSSRRSTRRNPNPNSDNNDDNDDDNDDGDDLGCSVSNKKEKRLNLFLNSGNNNGDVDSGSKPDPVDVGLNKRKRKIDSTSTGSRFDSPSKDEKNSALAKRVNTQQESKLDDGPSTTTPLPDNKLLLFILDRLQKKDTYGVFSEPVDPEELPDYHEVIQHPMDFSTVKKKVLDNAYADLEEFEKDVFLICSNAMQYNAPDTIYFRQARSIQELANKDFENLRHESDDENEPESGPKVARRGRPPLKNLFKRPPGRPPLERPNSTSHEQTPPTTAGTTNRSNNDVKKGSPVTPVTEKQVPANSLAQSLYGSRLSEASNGSTAERYEKSEDMTGSASKWSLGKNWKKNNNIVFDETRRNTYKQTSASACRQEMSVLTTFHGERKLLIPVGFHTEYAYARSLSRFAAKLGPIAWKVASRKIERCLPSGIKFGPGWVVENEGPIQKKLLVSSSISGDRFSAPTQGMIDPCGDKPVSKTEENSLPEVSISSQSKLDDGSAKVPIPSSVLNNGAASKLNSKGYEIHQSSQNKSRVNGLNGGYGANFVNQMGKMIGPTRPCVSRLQSNPGPSLSKTEAQNFDPPSGDSNDCGEAQILDNSNVIKSSGILPNTDQIQRVSSGSPDLNVGFLSPGSPGAGRTDSLHPDLALQL